MIKLVKRLRDYFDPPQDGTVEYEHYIRSGDCNQCGQCCTDIYLVHGEKVIKTVAQFERLKTFNEDYQHFVPLEENSTGVVFKCSHLQPDNSCGIYHHRPLFCRKYPSEETLLCGGTLSSECSFTFKAKHAFSEILQKTAEKKRLNPGQLLNDVKPYSTEEIERQVG